VQIAVAYAYVRALKFSARALTYLFLNRADGGAHCLCADALCDGRAVIVVMSAAKRVLFRYIFA
jgi:hypothetical protein